MRVVFIRVWRLGLSPVLFYGRPGSFSMGHNPTVQGLEVRRAGGHQVRRELAVGTALVPLSSSNEERGLQNPWRQAKIMRRAASLFRCRISDKATRLSQKRMVRLWGEHPIDGSSQPFDGDVGSAAGPGRGRSSQGRKATAQAACMARPEFRNAMKDKMSKLSEPYLAALRKHLPSGPPASSQPATQLGLLCMRERVAMVDGKLTVESAPGQSTTIQAQIPLGQGPAQTSAAGNPSIKPLRNPHFT